MQTVNRQEKQTAKPGWKNWHTALALSAVVGVGAVAMKGGDALAQVQAKVGTQLVVAQMVENAQKELNLTPSQREQIRAIVQDAVPRGVAIHDSSKLSPGEKQSQLSALYFETRKKVDAKLDAPQRARLANWQTTAGQRVQSTLVQVGDELNLTPAQRRELQPVFAKTRVELFALKDNMNLTLAQKFVRAKQLGQSTRVRANAVLNPAQEKQLQRMIGEFESETRRQIGTWRTDGRKS